MYLSVKLAAYIYTIIHLPYLDVIFFQFSLLLVFAQTTDVENISFYSILKYYLFIIEGIFI